MDQSNEMVSSELESTLGQTSKKAKPNQRIPKCTRCQNHGKKVEVKFHKRECEYRYCLCDMCILTMKKQQIMKVQTAQRRARQQYEMLIEMKKKKAKAKDSETPPAPSISGNSDNSESCSRSISEPVVSVPILQNRPPLLPHTTSPSTPLFEPESKTINEAYGNGLDTISNQDTRYSLDGHRDSDTEEVEVLLGYSARLLQRFGYPWESLSLMYVILKDSRADVEVAMRRITKDKGPCRPETRNRYPTLKIFITFTIFFCSVNFFFLLFKRLSIIVPDYISFAKLIKRHFYLYLHDGLFFNVVVFFFLNISFNSYVKKKREKQKRLLKSIIYYCDS